jgi:predicted ATP-dependent endonuclease of OLD family
MAKLKKNNNQIFSLNKIKQLSLENFKGFEKKTNLEFSPGINLIYGRNSAGKSTIIQSLRLLKQSLYIKSSPCNFHLVVPSFMRIPGSLAFPEGFSGLINKKDLSKDLTMGLGTYGQGYTRKADGKKYRVERFIEHKFNNKKNNKFPNIKSIKLIKQNFFEEDYTIDRKQKIEFVFKEKERFKHNKLSNILTLANKHRNLDGYNVLGMLQAHKEKRVDLSPDEMEFQYLDVKNSNFNFSIYDELYKKINKDFDRYSKTINQYIEFGLSGVLGLNIKTLVKRMDASKKKSKKKVLSKSFTQENDGRFTTIGKSELNSLKKFIKSKYFNDKEKFKKFLYDNFKQKLKLIRFKDELYDISKLEAELDIQKKTKSLTLLNPLSYEIYIHDLLLIAADLPVINIRKTFENTLDDLRYSVDQISVIPGLRQLPVRYLRRGLEEKFVGENAENIGDLLNKGSIKKEVNFWFNKLEIPYEIDTKLVGNFYELIMKPIKKKSLSLSYRDVGLGYSLSLPLIITALTSTNSIILCEEPELHLHPKMQASLMELFMHSTINKKNQFIIETHSENILLRAQKLIRKGFKINNKDLPITKDYINIFNVFNSDDGSEVQKIELDNDGEFKTHWRDGFFSERLDELF